MSASILIDVASVSFGLFVASLIGLYAASRRYVIKGGLSQLASRGVDEQGFDLNVVRLLSSLPIPRGLTSRMGETRAESRLEAAGEPFGLTAQAYIRFKVALQLINVLIFFALALTMLLPAVGALMLAVVFAAALWKLPDWYLTQRQHDRLDDLNRAVPDMVDLLVVSVEGGLSLYIALRRVSTRFPRPLGVELRRAMSEVDRGASLSDVLRSVVDRTGAEEFRRFVTPYLQAQAQGGKVAENLRALSEDMRERRKQRAQERGRRAATLVLLPMMLCIFPALLITVVGPALMSFFASLSGR